MRIAIALTASLVISAACSDSNGPAASRMTKVTIIGGNGQTGPAGKTLPDSIVIVATDSNGKPAAQAAVIYGPSGSGTVAYPSGSTSTLTNNMTNNSGRAAAAWTLDASATKDTLFVTVTDPTDRNNLLTDTVYATATP